MNQTLRTVLVQESMFGNTRAVATAVAAGLELEGLDVTVLEAGQAPPLDSIGAELVVVGGPTHALSLSRPATRADAVTRGAPPAAAGPGLREWIEAGSRGGDGCMAAAFDTRAAKVKRLPAAAAHRAARLLKRRGYRLVVRPAGFLVADTKGPLLPHELERATAWGRAVARAALSRPAAAQPRR
jgi:hypothetical protein